MPARVFSCFADKEKRRRWLIEGEGWTVDDYTHDFRAGASDGSAFRWQSGPQMRNHTTYHEIVDNERIISSYSMSLEGKVFSVSLLTCEFKAQDGGTLLVQTEQGTYMNDPEAVKGREEGFRELMENLAREVSRGE